MTKNINGEIYSDLITSSDSRPMACGYYVRQKIDRIVIHHNDAVNKNVAINTWLANGKAQTSANYEIANDEIIGVVGEQTAAWHAGNGAMNARSIGLEHLNATLAPTYTISEKTYASSAKLIADICKRYGFYPDSTHIIPHKSVTATACPGGIDMNKLIKMAQAVYAGKKVTVDKGNGETVWQHNGLWYTDKKFTKKANGRIKHMGQYWTFVGGKITAKPVAKKAANVDQILHIGEHFKARSAYRVDAMKFINGIWQVVNDELTGGEDINWTVNGFGVESVDKVDAKGKKTADQNLAVGDYFRLHSERIRVEDVDGNGVALSTRYGNVWVDASTLTEVK